MTTNTGKVTNRLIMNAVVRTPFTKKDYEDIDAMCDLLVTHLKVTIENSQSHWLKLTAEDIIDGILNLKSDMADRCQQDGKDIEEDGFVTMTGLKNKKESKV